MAPMRSEMDMLPLTSKMSTTFFGPAAREATHSRGVSDWCSMCDQNSTYGSHSLPGGVRLVFHVRPELDLWVALTPRGVSDCLHGLAT